MSELETTPMIAPPQTRRPLFWLGIALCILPLTAYIVQFQLNYFSVPWYLPVSTTLGVLFLGVAAWQHPGVWRYLGLVFFALLCAGEWFFLTVGSRVPAYTGPGQKGEPLPTFAATFADGKPFTNQSLANAKSTVLLFFRGRW